MERVSLAASLDVIFTQVKTSPCPASRRVQGHKAQLSCQDHPVIGRGWRTQLTNKIRSKILIPLRLMANPPVISRTLLDVTHSPSITPCVMPEEGRGDVETNPRLPAATAERPPHSFSKPGHLRDHTFSGRTPSLIQRLLIRDNLPQSEGNCSST